MTLDLIPSKVFHYFFNPLSFCLFLFIASAILALRRNRTAVPLLFTSLGILWTCSMPIVSSFLISPLERKYLPVPVSESPEGSAIVLLGGAAGAAEPPRIDVDLTDSSDRVWHAANLYAAGKAPFVITTGGGTRVFDEIEPEANSMAVLLHDWGVPGNSILIEPASLNTRQNAVKTRRLLDEKELDSVLLVTSAMHMHRALAAFRTAGIKTIPSPTDYAVLEKKKLTIKDFLPDAGALGGTTAALREYLGLVFYRWRGWIK